jgi:hypothetical protein
MRSRRSPRPWDAVNAITIPKIERYGEIHAYDSNLIVGQMLWQPVADHTFDREFLGRHEYQTSRRD